MANLDQDVMNAAVAKAIVETLTPERHKEVLAAAVASLLNEKANPTNYGDKRSRIQVIFDDAARNVAEREVHRMLMEDETFAAKLRGLMADVADALFAPGVREELVAEFADRIRKGWKDRY